jgi:hypothetical protein
MGRATPRHVKCILSTDQGGVVSTFCHAAGQVTPNHPTDFGILAYDSKRDVIWWGNQGGGFPEQEGQVCNQGRPEWPKGSTYRNGFMRLNPETNTWTKVSEQATDGTGGSYFDVAGDRLLIIEGTGRLTAWSVAQAPLSKSVVVDFSRGGEEQARGAGGGGGERDGWPEIGG